MLYLNKKVFSLTVIKPSFKTLGTTTENFHVEHILVLVLTNSDSV